MGVKRVRQEKNKKRRNRRPSLLQGDNNRLFFYLPSEGPDNSSGQAQWMKQRSVCQQRVCVCWEVVVGGGSTKGLATDISWKLLDDVSAHQRTATAIVLLIGRQI